MFLVFDHLISKDELVFVLFLELIS